MDWPVAATILGVLGTICTAVVKFTPPRSGITDREFQALETRVDIGFRVIQEDLQEIKKELRCKKS